MTKKITFITGGQRSGKSSYAQSMALQLSNKPVYVATSAVWDDEHRLRIERHKADRGSEWTNIEKETALDELKLENRVVVVDCVMLWATNYFFRESQNIDEVLKLMKNEFDKFTQQDAHFIFVSNEIGLGGISGNQLQRRFTDLIGWLNQYIAAQADEVLFMVSGIPLKIK